jgi:16S rRNA (adenine1518-N6/adenine1519-N6)-dimethyltransferase
VTDRSKAQSIVRRGHRAVADSPATALRAAGVTPSKMRGQNFLVQSAVAARIVALAELTAQDEVVEIGPGLGVLTERLLAAPISLLHAIELDRALAERLRQKWAGRFDLIEADFLKVDLRRIVVNPPVKVIGNLPFNVAAAILRRLGEARDAIRRMVLMFQREVGERLRAAPGEKAYGALSVLTALDWEIIDHFRVEAGSFHPRPNVDAEVLALIPTGKPRCPMHLRHAVVEVVRAGFAVRRKNLRNALSAGLRIGPEAAEQALRHAGIAPSERAERLALKDFVRLAAAMQEISGTPANPVRDA